MATVLVMAAFAVRAETRAHTRFVCEDALITARYAENLAAGEGFVFNPGERVLGTTTPLYTLLLALARVLGLSVPSAAAWLGLVADALVIGVIIVGLRRTLGWPARIVFSGGYLLLGSAVAWVGSGMETGLYILSIALALAAAGAGRERTAYGLAGMATLVRIDGGLVMIALLGQSLVARRRPLGGVITYAAVTGGWFVFSWLYFGSLLPHSIVAKESFALLSGFEKGAPLIIMRLLLFGDLTPGVLEGMVLRFHYVMLPLAVAGIGFSLAHPRLRAVVMWALAYFAFYVYAGMQFPWYLVPFHFGYILLASIGAGGVLAWATRRLRAKAGAVRLAIALVVAGVGLIMQGMSLWHGDTGWRAIYRMRGQILATEYRTPAEFLRRHTHPHVVYTGEIGYLGYYTGYPILDSVGIVSPAAVRMNRERRPLDLVREQKPPIVITAESDVGKHLEEKRWFWQDYVPFGWDPGRRQSLPTKRIWIRIDAIDRVLRDDGGRRAAHGMAARQRAFLLRNPEFAD